MKCGSQMRHSSHGLDKNSCIDFSRFHLPVFPLSLCYRIYLHSISLTASSVRSSRHFVTFIYLASISFLPFILLLTLCLIFFPPFFQLNLLTFSILLPLLRTLFSFFKISIFCLSFFPWSLVLSFVLLFNPFILPLSFLHLSQSILSMLLSFIH